MERSTLTIGVLAAVSRRPAPAAARFRDVDLDRLDDLLAATAPEIETALAFAPRLAPRRLDDLHPESLARAVPALAALVAARVQLDRPEAVRRALEEAGLDPSLLGDATRGGGDARGGAGGDADGGGDLMDELLSGASSRRTAATTASGDDTLARLVREITAASVDRTDHAQQERWRRAIDGELARRLRALLAAPALRAAEATWRGLRDLVRRAAPGGERVEVRVLDVSLAELLAASVDDATPIEDTRLHRLVVADERGTHGGRPFGLLLADFAFEDEPEHHRVLQRLGEIATRADAPLLAGAGARLFASALDGEKASVEWRALRAAPWARRLALCAPRVLARLPYGADADPVDAFPFEEIEDAGDRNGALVLGNAAWLVIAAALDAWIEDGGLGSTAAHVLREGLPFFTARANGESVGVGPTERVLSEAEARRVAEAGLVPVAAIRGRDAARIVALQSLAGGRLF